jgi:hypothetical protein
VYLVVFLSAAKVGFVGALGCATDVAAGPPHQFVRRDYPFSPAPVSAFLDLTCFSLARVRLLFTALVERYRQSRLLTFTLIRWMLAHSLPWRERPEQYARLPWNAQFCMKGEHGRSWMQGGCVGTFLIKLMKDV